MSPPEANVPLTIPPPLLREGEILGGRYRIEHRLGEGGMASIYRAVHTGLNQAVAIKVVSSLVRERPGIASHFVREARAMTRLKGEHVVRVFDVGTTNDGTPYLVMELLEGRDLAEILDTPKPNGERHRPTIEEAVDFTLQTCEALAEVHGRGIVHRDLKPANLFITRGADGRPCLKLIDFGISRIVSARRAASRTSPDVVMGSPGYMPPEQMESAADADARSDIWGVGAILYEMLVGRPPFDGESLFDTYTAALRSRPPPPSSERAGVPPGLDAIVLRCLQVEPGERFRDVAELAEVLVPYGGEGSASQAAAIARVLETSLALGPGDNDVTAITTREDLASVEASFYLDIARRKARRRRDLMLAGAAIFFVGIGLAARPIARGLQLAREDANTTAPAAADVARGTNAPATATTAAVAAAPTVGSANIASADAPRADEGLRPGWAPPGGAPPSGPEAARGADAPRETGPSSATADGAPSLRTGPGRLRRGPIARRSAGSSRSGSNGGNATTNDSNETNETSSHTTTRERTTTKETTADTAPEAEATPTSRPAPAPEPIAEPPATHAPAPTDSRQLFEERK